MTAMHHDVGTCVLPHRHHPDRARRAEPDSFVCLGCHGTMEQTLAELPSQYVELETRLPPGSTGWTARITGTPARVLPYNDPVSEHRRDIRAKLASWAMVHAEERDITPPADPEPDVTAVWLLRHLAWACGQVWVDDYAGELRELRGLSRALLYPSGRRREEIGPCIEADCNGTLVAILVPADDLLPNAITCDQDPNHEWQTSKWLLLGRRIHAGRVPNG